jgi:uncharacterized Fe-S cluster-containing radical SAM superfamily protein
MYDPVARANEVEKLVVRGSRRKYYRFRGARFYGGIATADCVGCCLRCAFCWGWNKVANPGGAGKFYTPQRVVERIVSIIRKRRFHQARLSGNEPTLGREHLLSLLSYLPREIAFILETNGILIGADPAYAQQLSAFENLHVRVSLKGCTQEEFSRLTGAEPEGFELQLKALENLLAREVNCHAAAMISFSSPESVDSLQKRLHQIHPSLADFEDEEIFTNPDIEKRLRQRELI